jgi:hypothetical protein
MTRTAYADFFEALAAAHVLIRHNPAADRVAFAVYDDPAEPLDVAPFVLAWADGYVMILENYELTLRGNGSGTHDATYPGAFWILGLPNDAAGRPLRQVHTEAESSATSAPTISSPSPASCTSSTAASASAAPPFSTPIIPASGPNSSSPRRPPFATNTTPPNG